jgi:hypothetical protein
VGVALVRRGLASLAFVLLAAAPAAAAVPVVLAPYRAVYDLSVDPARESSDMDVTGRLVTEFTGSPCAGYTTKARFVTDSTNADGEHEVTDSRMSSVETVDGRFDFTNETYTKGELSDVSEGTAQRAADGRITVKLTKPAVKTVDISAGSLFPTESLVRMIEEARKGTRFIGLDMYDGSENGETPLATAVVIGKPVEDSARAQIADGGFEAEAHWPMTISYFSRIDRSDDQPLYVMSGMFYQNGIASRVKFDYGEVTLAGKLTTLTMLPVTGCPGK